jgi:hypothetical protein
MSTQYGFLGSGFIFISNARLHFYANDVDSSNGIALSERPFIYISFSFLSPISDSYFSSNQSSIMSTSISPVYTVY